MNYDTASLKECLDIKGPEGFIETMEIVHVYHTARCADALERIATHLEDGQIATLDGRDIVLALREIKGKLPR